MKTILALTTAILAIVFCNCGNNEINSGKYYPQNSTTALVTELSVISADSTGNYRQPWPTLRHPKFDESRGLDSGSDGD